MRKTNAQRKYKIGQHLLNKKTKEMFMVIGYKPYKKWHPESYRIAHLETGICSSGYSEDSLTANYTKISKMSQVLFKPTNSDKNNTEFKTEYVTDYLGYLIGEIKTRVFSKGGHIL